MVSTQVSGSGRRLHGPVLAAVVGALMLTLLLEALDQTIVGTAMPRVLRELGGLDRYSWVVTIYLLASTALIPLSGKLSDQFGRKGFLLGGTAIFLLGSALCGAAQDIDQLILFRALQGVGGGMGIALVFTVVADIFPAEERGRWQGIVGGVYAISSVVGPTFGGWLADSGPLIWPVLRDSARWRWVFYINLPLGLVALLGLLLFLPATGAAARGPRAGWAALGRIDFAGAGLALVATICLFLGLTWGADGTYAWASAPVAGTLAGAALLYAALIWAERRAAEPIIPLALFRSRVFTADALLAMLQLMALFGMAFYVPLFIQRVLGASATQAGATMTPFSLSIPIGGFLAGNAITLLRRHQVVALGGTLIMIAGLFLLTLLTPATPLTYVGIAVATAGLGMGVLSPVVTTVAQNELVPAQLGAGTAAVRYLSQIGGAIGVGVVGAIVNESLAAGFPLAAAIQHGLLAVLVFGAVALLVACFVTDPPRARPVRKARP